MSKKPLEQLTFFIDRSLGGKLIANALRQAGAKVEVHDAHFKPDTPDVDWLAAVGKRGWIVLSKDERIRRNPVELAALSAANVKAFFLTQQGMTGPDMAALFVEVLEGMANRAVSEPAPFIYSVSKLGHFAKVKL